MSNELQTLTTYSIGRWTKLEHQRFLQGLQLYGRNWKQISKHVGTRNGAQIRSHAQKYFDKFQKCQLNTQSAEGNAQKLSSSVELTSAPEEETNVTFSYYLSEITKFVAETHEVNFWVKLVCFESKKCSAEPIVENSNKYKLSFTPYQKTSKEKSITAFEQQNKNVSN